MRTALHTQHDGAHCARRTGWRRQVARGLAATRKSLPRVFLQSAASVRGVPGSACPADESQRDSVRLQGLPSARESVL